METQHSSSILTRQKHLVSRAKHAITECESGETNEEQKVNLYNKFEAQLQSLIPINKNRSVLEHKADTNTVMFDHCYALPAVDSKQLISVNRTNNKAPVLTSAKIEDLTQNSATFTKDLTTKKIQDATNDSWRIRPRLRQVSDVQATNGAKITIAKERQMNALTPVETDEENQPSCSYSEQPKIDCIKTIAVSDKSANIMLTPNVEDVIKTTCIHCTILNKIIKKIQQKISIQQSINSLDSLINKTDGKQAEVLSEEQPNYSSQIHEDNQAMRYEIIIKSESNNSELDTNSSYPNIIGKEVVLKCTPNGLTFKDMSEEKKQVDTWEMKGYVGYRIVAPVRFADEETPTFKIVPKFEPMDVEEETEQATQDISDGNNSLDAIPMESVSSATEIATTRILREKREKSPVNLLCTVTKVSATTKDVSLIATNEKPVSVKHSLRPKSVRVCLGCNLGKVRYHK